MKRKGAWLFLSTSGILIWWGWPWLNVLRHGIRLACQPAPTSLSMPVPGVHPGQIADTFGAPRAGGRRHEGIDIFAPRHTPVVSPTPGVVIGVGWNKLGGRTVRVLGPGGRWFYHAHLQTVADLRLGEWIPAGHQIGTVGDSGNARGTPPHLHFGVYEVWTGAENPLPLLRRHRMPY